MIQFTVLVLIKYTLIVPTLFLGWFRFWNIRKKCNFLIGNTFVDSKFKTHTKVHHGKTILKQLPYKEAADIGSVSFVNRDNNRRCKLNAYMFHITFPLFKINLLRYDLQIIKPHS